MEEREVFVAKSYVEIRRMHGQRATLAGILAAYGAAIHSGIEPWVLTSVLARLSEEEPGWDICQIIFK